MKLNYLIKATPLISTILLIIFLCFSNQKEYTRLRILIWETPSLKLGTYLSISTGAGFILSYLITTNTAKLYQTNPKQNLKSKEENIDFGSSEIPETSIRPSYDNTLIERDIKDPLPTINANFRIIGRKERRNKNFISNNNYQDDQLSEFEDQYNEQTYEDPTINQVIPISNDWNDESYSTW